MLTMLGQTMWKDMACIYMFKDMVYLKNYRLYSYFDVYAYVLFSIISYHHIRVNIWAFESCWVGETNPKHMTAMSLKCVGSWGKKSCGILSEQAKANYLKQVMFKRQF